MRVLVWGHGSGLGLAVEQELRRTGHVVGAESGARWDAMVVATPESLSPRCEEASFVGRARRLVVLTSAEAPVRPLAAWAARAEQRTVLRMPFLYGPGVSSCPLTRYWRRMLPERPAVVVPRPEAERRRARGYIENVAAAVVWAATSPRAAGKDYAIADPGDFCEWEWAVEVGRACGWRGSIILAGEPVRGRELPLPGSGVIRREPGGRAGVGLRAGLIATIAWEQAHASPPADAEAAALAAGEDVWLRQVGLLDARGQAARWKASGSRGGMMFEPAR